MKINNKDTSSNVGITSPLEGKLKESVQKNLCTKFTLDLAEGLTSSFFHGSVDRGNLL